MATLTTQVITRAGVHPTYTSAAGGGDAMSCGSGMFLHIKNADASSHTVTLNVPAARTYEANVAITSPVITVGASSEQMIGPVDAQTFQDPTTGLCSLTYSAVTSVTVAAVQLAQP